MLSSQCEVGERRSATKKKCIFEFAFHMWQKSGNQPPNTSEEMANSHRNAKDYKLETKMVSKLNGLPSVSFSQYQDNYSAASTAAVCENQKCSNYKYI